MNQQVYEIVADATKYARTMTEADRIGLGFDTTMERLADTGVVTTEVFRDQIVQLELLSKKYGEDRLAAAQLEQQKQSLAATMARLVATTERLSAEQLRLNSAGQIYNATTGHYVSAAQARVSLDETLLRLGIRTTAQVQEEIRQINLLAAAHAGDARVVAQLTQRKAALERETGRLTGGVDDLRGRTGDATGVLFTFSQLVEDAQYGPRAWGNNLNQAVQQVIYLQQAVPKGTSVLGALAASLSGPAGVAVAVSVVVALLPQLLSLLDRGAEKAKKMADSMFSLESASKSALKAREAFAALAEVRERLSRAEDPKARKELEAVERRLVELQKEAAAQARARSIYEDVVAKRVNAQKRDMEDLVKKGYERARQLAAQTVAEAEGRGTAQVDLLQRYQEEERKRYYLQQQIALLQGPGGPMLRGLLLQNEELERQRDKLLGIDRDEKERLSLVEREREAQKELRLQLGEIAGLGLRRLIDEELTNQVLQRRIQLLKLIEAERQRSTYGGMTPIVSPDRPQEQSIGSFTLQAMRDRERIFGSAEGAGGALIGADQLRAGGDATEMRRLGDQIEEEGQRLVARAVAVRADVSGVMADFGPAIGGGLAQAALDVLTGRATFGQAFGGFLADLGQGLIASGAAGLALKVFIKDPVAAIIAGGALVAIGSAISGSSQQKANSFAGRTPGLGSGGGSGGSANFGGPGYRSDRSPFPSPQQGGASARVLSDVSAKLEKLDTTLSSIQRQGIPAHFDRGELKRGQSNLAYRSELTSVRGDG